MIADELTRRGVSNDDILRLFKEAQRELIALIDGMEKGSRFSQFRRKQLREIERIIMRLEIDAREWVEETLPDLMKAGAEETYEKIKSFGEKDFAVELAGVPEEAVKQLIENAWLDFGGTMIGLQKDASRKALEKRRLQERVLKGFIEGSAATRTQAQLVKDMKKRGFTVLRAANGFGRHFSLEHYAGMLVRTQNMTAYNLGAKSQMLASGRKYGIFPTIRPDIDGDDVCNEWERKKYVDLEKDPLPPSSTHPNCRHIVTPASFAQLKAERQDLYKEAVAFFRNATG